MILLENNHLLRTKSYINGEWVNASDGATFEVRNPYNGILLAQVADCGAAETQLAIERAHEAHLEWRQYTGGERGRILRRWYDLQLRHLDDLATLLTLEQGKPLAEARGEILYGASFVEWFAEEARRVYGDVIPAPSRDRRIVVLKQPIGVAAAITPWNFPNAMITRKVAPALAAGCAVVVKPAELTPLSALALGVLAEEAGLPAGVLNFVTTARPAVVGQVLCSHPLVRKLSFTGSTEVGKLLMRQSAANVQRISLELGGNAPFIVFDDADVEAAVAGAIASKYRNAGQTCVCSNRFFAQSGVYEAFTEKLAQAVSQLKVGDGMEADVAIGPLIEEKAVQFVEFLVQDATKKGARIAIGGRRAGNDSATLLFEPTVLTNVRPDMQLFSEEIFGPVAPVFKFETEAEVVALANNTPYGLAAYFYGRDHARIWRVAEALDYGMVGINTGMISTAVAPFGGVKESGFGREGSKYGIEEYLTTKYLCWAGI